MFYATKVLHYTMHMFILLWVSMQSFNSFSKREHSAICTCCRINFKCDILLHAYSASNLSVVVFDH